MSSHYAKPETALAKSKDFIRIGKQEEALNCLHVILHSRRYRQWTETHEQIMHSYIELAVGLQKNIKDALVMYQKICQTNQTQSLAKIMKRYADLSEAKAEEARKKAAEVKEEVAENLELTPEMIIAQLTSGNEAQDRSETEVLAPWVRYLWETYRAILDVLRNNDQLKGFYQEMCRAAFTYCRKFRRTGEFRRFVDLLRNHLIAIEKHAHQANAVNLKDPVTQRLYLETRFLQLEIAAELELWQDAYRTIEDIHDNMLLSDKPPEPHLMKTYYEKLAQIFWASDNALFHAYSISQFYQLTLLADEKSQEEEEEKGETKKQLEEEVDPAKRQSLANAVLLATLCILPRPNESETGGDEPVADLENEGNRRLALLLGFNRETPTRANLLAEIVANDVLTVISPFVRELYDLLEKRFGPLSMKAAFEPLLAQIDADPRLKKYVPALKNLAILRLSQQLGSVFKTIRISKFIELAPSLGPYHELERQLMLFVKWGHLNLRVDHRSRLFHFLEDGMESQKMKDQLSVLAQQLQQVADVISPMDVKEKQRERKNVFQSIMNGVEEEHKMVFERMREIERRKQRAEEIQQEKERVALEQKRAEDQKREQEEKQRLRDEAEKREKERVKKELEKKELIEKQQLLKSMKQKIATLAAEEKKFQRNLAEADKLRAEEVDKQKIKETETQLLTAAKKEIDRRRKEQSRRIEYHERALRIEEKPLLVQDSEAREKLEREKLEEENKRILVEDRKAFDKLLEEKKRFQRMTKDMDLFREKVLAVRREKFEKMKKEIQATKVAKGGRYLEAEDDDDEEEEEEEEPVEEKEEEEDGEEVGKKEKKDGKSIKNKSEKEVKKEKQGEKEKGEDEEEDEEDEEEKPKEKPKEKLKEPQSKEKEKEPEKEKDTPKEPEKPKEKSKEKGKPTNEEEEKDEEEEDEEDEGEAKEKDAASKQRETLKKTELPPAASPTPPRRKSPPARRTETPPSRGSPANRDRRLGLGGGGGGGGRSDPRSRERSPFRKRDERSPRRRDDRFERSPARRNDRFERSPARRERSPAFRRERSPRRSERERSPPFRRGGGGGGGGGGRRERTPPPRRVGTPTRRERTPPPRREEAHPAEPQSTEGEGDDGFTVVTGGKRKKGGRAR